MKILEKEFEDIVFDHIQTEEGCKNLADRGLRIPFNRFSYYWRQLNLKEYGIADIVKVSFYQYTISIDIIELKVTEFNLSHLLQLGRYIAAVKGIVSQYSGQRHINISAKLIVNGLDSNAEAIWIENILDADIEVYNSEYRLDGIYFEKKLPGNWRITGASKNPAHYVNVKALKEIFKAAYLERMKNRSEPDEPIDDLPF